MDGLVRYLVPVLTRMEWASLVYFFIVNSLYGVLLVSACWQMCQHILRTKGENLSRVLGSAVAPTISMLAPAHDEAATITESVTSLMAVSYPNLEVIVVNDGSSDETMSVLIEEFELVPIYPIFQDLIQTKPVERLYRSRSYPNLVVADKQNGGKADALNAALNLATGQLVCAIDADTLIETDALQRMARPFLAGEQVLAAGGTIRLVNSSRVRRGRVVNARAPREALPGIQAVEYMRAFLFGRLGWNSLGGNLIISGAFGLFRREAMIKVGGYARDTVGEDMELILRLRCQSYEEKRPHKVAFIPDPVAWTEAPESFRMLGNQRDRWHRGLADVIWRYRRVFFNPRYGIMGMVVYPYFFFAELLAPVLEAVGLLTLIAGFALGAINRDFAMLFFLAAYGYGLLLSILTLLLEDIFYHRYNGLTDRLLLLLWALLENCGYRQLTVFWRLRGLYKAVRGRKGWGAMEHQGFTLAESLPTAAQTSSLPTAASHR